jgi:hypothetical protein
MRDTEQDRIFNEWLVGLKGILFKVVHAYAFEHADRQDLFQEIAIQVWRSVSAFLGDSSVHLDCGEQRLGAPPLDGGTGHLTTRAPAGGVAERAGRAVITTSSTIRSAFGAVANCQ